ncbi:helix-turn-helix domain-containing protein [Streptomyces hydrogenans]
MHHNDWPAGSKTVRLRGSLVRELRIRKGFGSQLLLAKAVGCGRSTVSLWEASRTVPHPAHLARLSEALGVTPSKLLDENTAEGSGNAQLRALRISSGLLQRDVSAALSLSGRGTYSDVERGRQQVPERWIPALSRLYGQPEEVIRSAAFRRTGKLNQPPVHA